MKKFLTGMGAGLGAFALPVLVLAQEDINSVGDRIIDLINNTLVPLIFAAAFIVFIWGIFQYFIFGANSDDGKEKGKTLMIYGLIGFFVMASVWGIINIVVNSLNLDQEGRQIELPRTPGLNE